MYGVVTEADRRTPLSGDAFVRMAYDYFHAYPRYGLGSDSIDNFTRSNIPHIRALCYAYLVTNLHLYAFASCKAKDLFHYVRTINV